jgi:hypothetical protein
MFPCIPQRKKTSSVVYHNGGKPLSLYPTTEGNIFHCGIQRKKTCGVVGYNAEDFSVLDPTILLCCIVGYSTSRKILLWCRIQWKKTPALWDTTEKNLLAIVRFFSVVSHNGKNHFCCILKRRKTSVPQRKETLPLYPTTAKKRKT